MFPLSLLILTVISVCLDESTVGTIGGKMKPHCAMFCFEWKITQIFGPVDQTGKDVGAEIFVPKGIRKVGQFNRRVVMIFAPLFALGSQ